MLSKHIISALMTTSLITLGLVHTAQAEDGRHQRHYERNDYAKVVDAKPLYETVAYSDPQQECYYEERVVRHKHRESKTPVLLGSIIGGAIGNELGHKGINKKVGIVVGSILGGSIAKDITHNKQNNHGRREVKRERICTTTQRTHYKEELVGYNVAYRYRGQVYHTTMGNHPGDRIQIAVSFSPVIQ